MNETKATQSTDATPALSGSQIRSLMRYHRKAIRGLAQEMDVTMTRVREVRARGVEAGIMAHSWIYSITGRW